jgi:fructan beta-fructosidase
MGPYELGTCYQQGLGSLAPLPVALAEDGDLRVYSGFAVVDFANSSGFGTGGPPLVAIYTGHREESSARQRVEDQRLACSNDRGRTWTHHPGNPVLGFGLPDFRDPKVFWHEQTKRWIMAVVLPMAKKDRALRFGGSQRRAPLSEFRPAGAWRDPTIWECPDLFSLKVEGEPDGRKWVLIVNINSGAPAGGSGTQYFVGEFDGTQFRLRSGRVRRGCGLARPRQRFLRRCHVIRRSRVR